MAGATSACGEALDLCLACKGCKSECPVNVDMATYKAEFLAHYYAGRLRPPSAYSMGLIYWWARLASRAPALANALTHAPLLGTLVKALGGIAPPRAKLPRFAPMTFRAWFQRRGPHATRICRRCCSGPIRSTITFIPRRRSRRWRCWRRRASRSRFPARSLCCGRPLYDFGMLDTAKRLLREILEALGPRDRDRHPGGRPGAELCRGLP